MLRVSRNGDGVVSDVAPSCTDDELIARVVTGSEEAFRRLHERYAVRVRLVITRMINDRDRAEEITQEVFVRVFLHADRYLPGRKFSTWLFTIAVNLARNEIRYRIRHRNTLSLDVVPQDKEASFVETIVDQASRVDTAMEGEELYVALSTAVQHLPAKYRAVLTLRDIEGLSYGEVGDLLGIPGGTVRSRINRGRSLLAQQLRAYVNGNHTTGNGQGGTIMAARTVVSGARQGVSAARATSAAASATLPDPAEVLAALSGAPARERDRLSRVLTHLGDLDIDQALALRCTTGLDGSLHVRNLEDATQMFRVLKGDATVSANRVFDLQNRAVARLHRVGALSDNDGIADINRAVRAVAEWFQRNGSTLMEVIRSRSRDVQRATGAIPTAAEIIGQFRPLITDAGKEGERLELLLTAADGLPATTRGVLFFSAGLLDGSLVHKERRDTADRFGMLDGRLVDHYLDSALQTIGEALGESNLALEEIQRLVARLRQIRAASERAGDAKPRPESPADTRVGVPSVPRARDPYADIFDGLSGSGNLRLLIRVQEMVGRLFSPTEARFFCDYSGLRWDGCRLSDDVLAQKHGVHGAEAERKFDALFLRLEEDDPSGEIDQDRLERAVRLTLGALRRPALPDTVVVQGEDHDRAAAPSEAHAEGTDGSPAVGASGATKPVGRTLLQFIAGLDLPPELEPFKRMGALLPGGVNGDTFLERFGFADGLLVPKTSELLAARHGITVGAVQQRIKVVWDAMRAHGVLSDGCPKPTVWMDGAMERLRPLVQAALAARSVAPQPEGGDAAGAGVAVPSEAPLPVDDAGVTADVGSVPTDGNGAGHVDIDELEEDLALVGRMDAPHLEAPSTERAAAVPSPSVNGADPHGALFSITILPPGIGEEITIVGTDEGTLIRHKR